MKSKETFEKSIKEKKIPLLTLDNQWHRLFSNVLDPEKAEMLQKRLNDLIKKQGKYTTELKDIRKIKSKLMNEIVEVRDDSELPENAKNKKLAENTRLINNCNIKSGTYEDELLDLPREIDKVNRELMLITMFACYNEINVNINSMDEISEWVASIRVELKKKLIAKQKMGILNREMYSYMHNIFGAEVVDLFDFKYLIDDINEDKNKEGKNKEGK
jgi:hypothetical protein